MLTSFHPKTYFFWGKCFLLSEKTKVQPAQKPGFPVEKAFTVPCFFCFHPNMKRACKRILRFSVFLMSMSANDCQFFMRK